jgi:hypothetical protein
MSKEQFDYQKAKAEREAKQKRRRKEKLRRKHNAKLRKIEQ